MSDISLNFDPLLYGAAIALAVLLLGTPVIWRASLGLPRLPRILGTTLACIGLAGLISLALSFSSYRLEDTTLSAVVFAALLQALAIPVLIVLAMKS